MNIGIVGGGQLGQMLAQAGQALGLRFRFLEPADSPPARGCGSIIRAAYDDPIALAELAGWADVITYEFENVPVAALQTIAESTPVLPPINALKIAQNRIAEKTHMQRAEIPVGAWRAVNSQDELERAVADLGLPLIAKTTRFGYDGKGQAPLREERDVSACFENLGGHALIAEKLLTFDREVSLIGCRYADGSIDAFPLTVNHHVNGILHHSSAPLADPTLQKLAERHFDSLCGNLNYVGVMTIEFFEIDGVLYGNEFAPRVHNSGHWTIEGANVSQFELHLRAVCNLARNTIDVSRHAGMVNFIGETPSSEDILELGDSTYHDYGKSPRAGRKLGHATVICDSAAERDRKLAKLLTLCRL